MNFPYMNFPYDPNMDLAYADDATSMETQVVIIDPQTNERSGFTCDNLTNVIYFLAAHDLRPVREGIGELAKLDIPQGKDLGEYLPELTGYTAADILEGFRKQNNLPVSLYIEVHGDPSLTDKFQPE